MAYSRNVGIRLQHSANSFLSYLLVNKSEYGLLSNSDSDLLVKNMTILKAINTGILLIDTKNSTIVNTLVKGFSDFGPYLSQTKNASSSTSTNSCSMPAFISIPETLESSNGIYIGGGRNLSV